MTRLNRRHFVAMGAAVGSSLALPQARGSMNILGANERLRIAVAGLNGRGKSHIDGWLGQDNVEIAWVIDPDEKVLGQTQRLIEEKSGGKSKPKVTADVREALEDKGLDAISVATPNHWHSLLRLWGAQAGRHG